MKRENTRASLRVATVAARLANERSFVRLTSERSFVSQAGWLSTPRARRKRLRPPTRERILTEALNLFAQSGYGGASMRELARRVGIRESSLYNHFSGKAAILEAIVSEHGPASSASRLEEPRYRQLRASPPRSAGSSHWTSSSNGPIRASTSSRK